MILLLPAKVTKETRLSVTVWKMLLHKCMKSLERSEHTDRLSEQIACHSDLQKPGSNNRCLLLSALCMNTWVIAVVIFKAEHHRGRSVW